MATTNKTHQELRKFQRLRGTFPVDFTIVRLQGDVPGIDWQQATTENISQEGICIHTTNLTEPTIKYFRDQNVYLELRMKIPPDEPYIRAVCDVVWYEKEGDDANCKFTIGLKFRSIHQKELDRVIWHARLFDVLSKAGVFLCIAVVLVLIIYEIKINFFKH